jgi:hypothetical protein
MDADGVNRLSSVSSANRRPAPEWTDRLANCLPKTRRKDSSIAITPKLDLQNISHPHSHTIDIPKMPTFWLFGSFTETSVLPAGIW